MNANNHGFPRWLYLPAGIALLLVVLPILGLMVRVPWIRLAEILTRDESRDALLLSLRTCLVSLVLVLILGTPLALLISRTEGFWAYVWRTFAVLPMVFPPVVAGLALLVTLGRRGVVGQYLSLAGIEIGFTTIAVVLGQTFVAMPYYVVSLESALRTFDSGYERIAATLGASPTYVLRRVTLPLLTPAIVGGATMAFARALGEFGATLTFAGSLQGVTRTLPQAIYLLREDDSDLALALSVVLVLLAATMMGLSAIFTTRRTKQLTMQPENGDDQ